MANFSIILANFYIKREELDKLDISTTNISYNLDY